MASLDFVAIPAVATRLQGPKGTSPAKQVLTPLPKTSDTASKPSLPSSPTPSTTSLTAASLTSPTNAAFSMLPQLLFSSAIPASSGESPRNHQRGGASLEQRPLLTARDPLSLPITSNNFKRFVARAGPMFWFLDRIEEVFAWKRGNSVTAAWLAGYAFLCYFPKMVFLVPHAAIIGIVLSTYQYPTTPSNSDTRSRKASPTSETTSGESRSNNVDWQANLQGIQNIMGFVSETYDLVEPYTQHLILTPAHLTRHPQVSNVPPPASPYPPYILLTLLLTSPPLLLVLASPLFPARLVTFIAGALPVFALHPRVGPLLQHLFNIGQRLYACLAGHRDVVEDDKEVLVLLQLVQDLAKMGFIAQRRAVRCWGKVNRMMLQCRRFLAKCGLGVARTTVSDDDMSRQFELDGLDDGGGVDTLAMVPMQSLLERFVDDDRLEDRVWTSELREVEIWENERFQPAAAGSASDEFWKHRSISSAILSPKLGLSFFPDGDPDVNEIPLSEKNVVQRGPSSDYSLDGEEGEGELGPGTWAKANLKATERKAWARGRDGWGGIRPRARTGTGSFEAGEKGGRKGDKDEGKGRNGEGGSTKDGGGVGEEDGKMGYVSNLTFSLSPGWAFVRTEGWRKDRVAEWAASGAPAGADLADTSGWIYTNDAWGGQLRKHPVKGSVTRRRRWVRRIWYNGEEEGLGEKSK